MFSLEGKGVDNLTVTHRSARPYRDVKCKPFWNFSSFMEVILKFIPPPIFLGFQTQCQSLHLKSSPLKDMTGEESQLDKAFQKPLGDALKTLVT